MCIDFFFFVEKNVMIVAEIAMIAEIEMIVDVIEMMIEGKKHYFNVNLSQFFGETFFFSMKIFLM